MSAPFDPKKANAAAKAKKKESIPKNPKTEVSNYIQRKADMTQEKTKLDGDKAVIVEEELKRYNFLRSNIDWDSLRQFYENPSDDHELYGNHLDMDRWLLFVELILFLHDNIKTSQVKTVKTSEGDVPISSKITLGAIRAPLIPYAPLKPFNFGENGNENTSIQHLLNFMQQNKSLGRLFIEQKLGVQHNKSDEDDDLFGEDDDEDADEKKAKKRSMEIAKNIDLNKKFDAFAAEQDAIEYNNYYGIGHKQHPVKERLRPLDDVEIVEQEQDQFKELRKKWQKIEQHPNAQNARRDDRFDKLEKYSSRMGPIKQAASLTKYFPNDAEDISSELYHRVMATNGSLNDYLLGVARIAVFVDEAYLKSVAKTFNQKLARQYYNLESLLDLTVDEILQEIYQHPDNRDSIATISQQVSTQIETYITNSMKRITNQPYNEYAADQTRKSLETSFEAISQSPSLTKTDCSNKDDVSFAEDLDIIYYTDIDDKKVYCFKLFDLYKQFEAEDFSNPKSGKKFNQLFIDNILFHHKKPKSPVKKERVDVFHSSPADGAASSSSLIDLFKEIESGLDPELKAEYEKEFGAKK